MRLLVKLGCGKYTFINRKHSDPRHRLENDIELERCILSRLLGCLRMFQFQRISEQNQQTSPEQACKFMSLKAIITYDRY
jgi:hypothetical protein